MIPQRKDFGMVFALQKISRLEDHSHVISSALSLEKCCYGPSPNYFPMRVEAIITSITFGSCVL